MQEDVIDLKELYYRLLKNKGNIARVTGICGVLAAGYLLVASPVYQSESVIRIKQAQSLSNSILSSLPMGNSVATKQVMSTYAEIIKSRTVVNNTIKKATEPNKEGEYMGYEAFKAKIATTPYRDTELLKVTVTGSSPEEAQRLNNALINEFLDRLTTMGQEQQRLTKGFLENRLLESGKEVDKAAKALSAYRQKERLLDLETASKLTGERIGSLEKLEAENKVRLVAAQAGMATAQQQLGKAAGMTENATINAYRAKLAELNSQRLAFLEKYTAAHPAVQQVEANIKELEGAIGQEITRVVAMEAPSSNPIQGQLLAGYFTSATEAAIAEANLNTIASLKKDSDKKLTTLTEREQEYLQLQRQAVITAEIHTMLAKRLEEAKVAEAAVVNDVQIVDNASLAAAPIAPNKSKTLLMFLLAGFVGSCGFVVLKELLNDTIKTKDDVTNKLKLPILGAVPKLEAADTRAEEQPKSIFAKLWRYVWKN